MFINKGAILEGASQTFSVRCRKPLFGAQIPHKVQSLSFIRSKCFCPESCEFWGHNFLYFGARIGLICSKIIRPIKLYNVHPHFLDPIGALVYKYHFRMIQIDGTLSNTHQILQCNILCICTLYNLSTNIYIYTYILLSIQYVLCNVIQSKVYKQLNECMF